jgi:hypothetical protein
LTITVWKEIDVNVKISQVPARILDSEALIATATAVIGVYPKRDGPFTKLSCNSPVSSAVALAGIAISLKLVN